MIRTIKLCTRFTQVCNMEWEKRHRYVTLGVKDGDTEDNEAEPFRFYVRNYSVMTNSYWLTYLLRSHSKPVTTETLTALIRGSGYHMGYQT